jgi:hypothetical protein
MTTEMTLTRAVTPLGAAIGFFKQWKILSNHVADGQIHLKATFDGPADRNYQLKNGRVRKFLHWEDQIGMNIGWTDDAEPATAVKAQRWFFHRLGNDTAPLRYGETIAIGNGKPPSFMCYEERFIGVNLQWHDDPCFQWKVLGGKPGSPVKATDWVALYNTKDKEFFIYVDRTVGGDVGWPSSKTWGEQVGGLLTKFAEEALKKLAAEAVEALLEGALA